MLNTRLGAARSGHRYDPSYAKGCQIITQWGTKTLVLVLNTRSHLSTCTCKDPTSITLENLEWSGGNKNGEGYAVVALSANIAARGNQASVAGGCIYTSIPAHHGFGVMSGFRDSEPASPFVQVESDSLKHKYLIHN